MIYVQEELGNINTNSETSKRTTYSEKCKVRIAPYAVENGTQSAIMHFKNEFPKLCPSTVRPWMKKYKESLVNPTTTIRVRRGRPLYLSRELDEKLQAMIINLRMAGAEINAVVIKGILAGLVCSNLAKYGKFVFINKMKSVIY